MQQAQQQAQQRAEAERQLKQLQSVTGKIEADLAHAERLKQDAVNHEDYMQVRSRARGCVTFVGHGVWGLCRDTVRYCRLLESTAGDCRAQRSVAHARRVRLGLCARCRRHLVCRLRSTRSASLHYKPAWRTSGKSSAR